VGAAFGKVGADAAGVTTRALKGEAWRDIAMFAPCRKTLCHGSVPGALATLSG
jgi:hypothetical protein